MLLMSGIEAISRGDEFSSVQVAISGTRMYSQGSAICGTNDTHDSHRVGVTVFAPGRCHGIRTGYVSRYSHRVQVAAFSSY